MHRKVYLFIIVIFTFFLTAFFAKRFGVELLTSPQSVINGYKRFEIADGEAACANTNSIEYYYYNEPVENPRNNKFGLYVYAEKKEFLELAQNLVNSNGGDWGYVLIPYNVKDYDYVKWRDVFERLYNKHLIPIIQLWDIDPDDFENQTEKAARFLDSFAWPVKQRYVSVYNEPNDAKFWRGYIDPEEYAKILNYTVDVFKSENPNFFMLNGALNVSANTSGLTMDAFVYMSKMDSAFPGIFSKLDGWASHSYPQPNFSGNPAGVGRWSIRAYDEELRFLKNALGVEKGLPVFITETGWAHAEGESYNPTYYSVREISASFEYAFKEVWLKDDRVVAVTPFTVWYDPPFDHFSWVNADGVPYEHYDVVKRIRKVSGTPQALVKESFEVSSCR